MFKSIRNSLWPQAPEKGDAKIVQSRHGPIIINRHDTQIGRSIQRYGSWQEETIDELALCARHLLKAKAQVVIHDVGANVGVLSLGLAQALGGACRIRAFEAQEPLFHMLCGTLALNSLRQVRCHLAAVGEKAGERLRFELPDYARPNNIGGLELVPPLHSDNGGMSRSGIWQEVETVTIDQFAEDVQILKIDVEGMEDQVLRGAAGTIARARPFCQVETGKSDEAFIRAFFAAQNYVLLPRHQDVLAVPREHQAALNLPGAP